MPIFISKENSFEKNFNKLENIGKFVVFCTLAFAFLPCFKKPIKNKIEEKKDLYSEEEINKMYDESSKLYEKAYNEKVTTNEKNDFIKRFKYIYKNNEIFNGTENLNCFNSFVFSDNPIMKALIYIKNKDLFKKFLEKEPIYFEKLEEGRKFQRNEPKFFQSFLESFLLFYKQEENQDKKLLENFKNYEKNYGEFS